MITVNNAGWHYITTRGTTDTLGYLYDSNLNLLVSDSDSGEDEIVGLLACSRPLSCSVLVRGQYNTTVGGYVLHVEGPGAGTVSDDHGLSPWSATPIADRKSVG